MRACRSSMLSKTTARPRCCSSCGEAAAGLIIAPSRRQVAAQHGDAGVGHAAAPRGRITSGSQIAALVEVLDQRPCR